MAGCPARVNPLGLRRNPDQEGWMVGKDKTREERLAAALRENLRRRKQARPPQPSSDAGGSGEGES